MPTDAYSEALDSLSDLGQMRVWSLLVTVFGDLAPDRPLDGPTLSAIMAEIGIKPEATRVALHRLRSDGWVASEKRGRTSLHRLTDQGQRDSDAARARIYGAPDDMDDAARVILMPAPTDLDPTRFAQIGPRVFMCSIGTSLPEGAMQMTPIGLPDWLGSQIETDTMRDAYKSLHAVLTDIREELTSSLTPMQTAALRVMIVHAWRRLALKHPTLPRAAHSSDWRGHDCRALVTDLLRRFARPDLDVIKAA
ncbi:PaaX family transcriptional regulator C-terminal domain-containing protein [uncultured Tateyamaria sp.]|uniref:PaaX family transcriptional regulator C-terminal domain-containing protein n=1 Tax=uncultured Tateyamaria sp. TaxID=455651 RepID=UPI002620173F|nr:PaaX family transcriptional regulator C-terminal domain-containing protein [uncultured Tateyamaria sp.]